MVAALLFCAAMQPIIYRVLERHPGVCAVCFADNAYLVGRASAVLSAQVDLDRHLLQDMGVASKPSEAHVYAPIWDEPGLDAPPQSFFDMAESVAHELSSTMRERVRVTDIEVLGCPLSNETFVTEFPAARVEVIAKDFAPCSQVDDGIAFYQLSRFCIMSRLGFSLRTSFPQHSVRSAKSLDEHMLRAWGGYMVWGRSAAAPDAGWVLRVQSQEDDAVGGVRARSKHNPIPNPQTPTPKSQPPNPNPQTPNPKPQTPNPKPQHQKTKTKPQTPNPNPQTLNPTP